MFLENNLNNNCALVGDTVKQGIEELSRRRLQTSSLWDALHILLLHNIMEAHCIFSSP